MANQYTPSQLTSRLLALMVLTLVLVSGLAAQQFSYKLTSDPDSAYVTINGTPVGKTPLVTKIDWSQAPSGGFEFVFTKPNYETVKYVVSEKPRVKENYKNVEMVKSRPHFDLATNPTLVDFDKVMAEFQLGRKIGKNKTFYGGDLTWDAYSRVGVDAFAARANDVLGSAGFRTPSIQKNELFSEEIARDSTARFLIGGKLTDIWVELGPTALVGIYANNRCAIEWKVYDKVLHKVVLTEVTQGVFDGKYTNPTEREVMMDLFQDALENFLHSGGLFNLVQEAGAGSH